MEFGNTEIDRLKVWCRDLEKVSSVIGYYIKLYTIQQALTLGTKESRGLAATLLNEVEEFKRNVTRDGGDEGAKLVLTDDSKAKTFFINFTMKMQNGLLEGLDVERMQCDTYRGLWCCIDLFKCIVYLWENQLSDAELEECKKRAKFAKYIVAKGIKAGSEEETEFEQIKCVESAGDMGTEGSVMCSKNERTQEVGNKRNKGGFKREEIDQLVDCGRKLDEVQKLARYAVSAIDYEDIATAKRELQKALAILNEM